MTEKIDWGQLAEYERYELRLVYPEAKKYLLDYLEWRYQGQARWLNWYYDACNWLRNSQGKGLLLTGAHGTGKSVFACDFFPSLLRATRELIIHSVNATTLSNPQATRHDEPFMRKYLKIVDDLGAEQRVNEYGIRYEAFAKIVEDCKLNNKFLIITTTMSVQELFDRYGYNTINALKDMCDIIDTNPDEYGRQYPYKLDEVEDGDTEE